MKINRHIMRSGILVVMLAVALSAAAQTSEAVQAVSEVSLVPRHNQWSLIHPDERPALLAVIKMSAADRDQLIQSGDARQRGIGLFIAEQQGDVAGLLSVSHLLADEEQTVSYAQAVADVGGYAQAQQTVGGYLSQIYLDWFGVEVDRSQKRFERYFGGVTDPDHLAYPWVVRLRRARADAARQAQIKESIGKLPEDVRWAVVTLGHVNGLYTEAEAQSLLAALSPATQAAIQNRDDLLPDEPLFRMNRGTHRKLITERCRHLLNAGG